jgi:hypothetical protein
MRPPCQFFQQGKCKYGSKCRFDHVRYTSVVDPPQWIYSSFGDLEMTEISPEEVRFSLMCSDTREILDSIWIKNYVTLCDHMDFLTRDARLESGSKRYVDIRKNPDAFIAPFDVGRVIGAIDEVRGQKSNPFQKASVGFQGSAGPQQRTHDGGQRGGMPRPPGKGEQPWSKWEHQQWNKGQSWNQPPHSTQQKTHKSPPSQPSQFGTGRAKTDGWSGDRQQPKGTQPADYGRTEEYDLEEPQPFPHRRENWPKSQSDEADFIEEDFEQGRVPYSFRKPR